MTAPLRKQVVLNFKNPFSRRNACLERILDVPCEARSKNSGDDCTHRTIQGFSFGPDSIACELKCILINGQGVGCTLGQCQGPKEAGFGFDRIDRKVAVHRDTM